MELSFFCNLQIFKIACHDLVFLKRILTVSISENPWFNYFVEAEDRAGLNPWQNCSSKRASQIQIKIEKRWDTNIGKPAGAVHENNHTDAFFRGKSHLGPIAADVPSMVHYFCPGVIKNPPT